MTLGEKMRILRKEKQFTQRQISDQMGITSSYVSEVEHNKSIPRGMYILAFCFIFGISQEKLFEGVEPCG